ncbi:MAG TPA: response regulator [bacterium]|nr:response regulator [bacterium]HPN45619.1 response regulator [bacterium]
MRILVVDDDYVSRTKLKSLLSAYGDCDAVPNGEMALEMFQKSHADAMPYNLITMDIEMPDLTGQEVVHRIRKWETDKKVKFSQQVKILMITIKNDVKDIMTSFSEGCEWYLTKPVTPDNLREALAKVTFP